MHPGEPRVLNLVGRPHKNQNRALPSHITFSIVECCMGAVGKWCCGASGSRRIAVKLQFRKMTPCVLTPLILSWGSFRRECFRPEGGA
jgi:hypothetical protein